MADLPDLEQFPDAAPAGKENPLPDLEQFPDAGSVKPVLPVEKDVVEPAEGPDLDPAKFAPPGAQPLPKGQRHGRAPEPPGRPDSMTPRASGTSVDIGTPVITGREPAPTPASHPNDEGLLALGKHLWGEVEDAKAKYVDPYVSAAQDFVRPGLEKVVNLNRQYSAGALTGNSQLQKQDAQTENFLRTAGGMLGGKKFEEGGDAAVQAVRAEQEQRLGPVGAHIVRGVVSSAPLMLVNPLLGARAAAAAPAVELAENAGPVAGPLFTATKTVGEAVLRGAKAGAKMGLLGSLLTPGQKVGPSIVQGAAFGAAAEAAVPVAQSARIGFTFGKEAVTKTAGKLFSRPVSVAVLTPEGTSQFAKDLGGLLEPVTGESMSFGPTDQRMSGNRGYGNAGTQVPKTPVAGPLQPGVARITQDNMGRWWGELHEVSADGQVLRSENLPLDYENAGRFGDLVKQHKLSIAMDDKLMPLMEADLSGDITHRIYRGTKYDPRNANTGTGKPVFSEPGDGPLRAIGIDEPNEYIRTDGGQKGVHTGMLPSPDAPPAEPINPPSNVEVVPREDGTANLRVGRIPTEPEMAPPAEPGTNPSIGSNDANIRAIKSGGEVGGGSGAPPPEGPNGGPPKQYHAYVQSNDGGPVQTGLVLGPAGDKPGQMRIRFQSGQIATVAEKDLHPTNLADIGFSDAVEPSATPVGPDTASPQLLADLQRTVTLLKQLGPQKGWNKALKTLFGGLFNDLQRGPMEARMMMNEVAGSRALGKTHEEIIQAFRRELPKKNLLDAAANDLKKVADGTMTTEELVASHPDVGAHFKQLADSTIEELRANHKQLVELGYVSRHLDNLMESGAVAKYNAQMYWAHTLGKGQWYKIHKQNSEAWDRAFNFFTAQAKAKGLRWNPEAIEGEMAQILGAENPTEAFWGSGVSKPWSHLKERDYQMPKEVREFLGEIQNGPIRIGYSLAAQRALIGQLNVFKELAEAKRVGPDGIAFNPYWSPERRPDLTIQVPNDPMYGSLKGGWMADGLSPILDMPKSMSQAPGLLRAFGRLFKTDLTVLNFPRGWVNNLRRNLKGGILSGAIDPLKPMESGAAVREAISAWVEWHKNPTASSAGRIVLEARRVNAIQMGAQMGAEVKSTKILRELENIAKQDNNSGGLYSVWEQLKDVMHEKVKKGDIAPEAVKEGYDAIDQICKLQAYIKLRKENLAAGMSVKDAARQASVAVNDAFINFEHAGKLAQTIQGSPFGNFAPFATSFIDEQRVNARTIMRIGQGDVKLLARLAAYGGLVSGSYHLMRQMGRMNGIGDGEVERAKATRSQYIKALQPSVGLVALPFRGKDGQIQFVDDSQWDTDLQLLRGPPDQPWWARIATSLAAGPFEGGQVMTGVEGAARALDIYNAQGSPQKAAPLPESMDWYDQLIALGKMGALPAPIARGMADYKRLDPANLKPGQEPLTASQMALRQLLPMAEPVGDATRKGKRIEKIQTVKQFKTDTRKAGRLPGKSPEQKQEVQKALKDKYNSYQQYKDKP